MGWQREAACSSWKETWEPSTHTPHVSSETISPKLPTNSGLQQPPLTRNWLLHLLEGLDPQAAASGDEPECTSQGLALLTPQWPTGTLLMAKPRRSMPHQQPGLLTLSGEGEQEGWGCSVRPGCTPRAACSRSPSFTLQPLGCRAVGTPRHSR